MTEHSIIRPTHSVRAILAGDQTMMRLVPFQRFLKWKKGDRLRVRETSSNCRILTTWRVAPPIILELTEDVYIEQLQDITEKDAINEGIVLDGSEKWHSDDNASVVVFSFKWDSVNAKRGYSWESNPTVAVVRFRRVK